MNRAVEKYGERQLDQAQEELAELIVAISKYKRLVSLGEVKQSEDEKYKITVSVSKKIKL